jgi:hypothetical protein
MESLEFTSQVCHRKKKKGQVSVTHPAIWEGDIRRIAVPGLLRLENLI